MPARAYGIADASIALPGRSLEHPVRNEHAVSFAFAPSCCASPIAANTSGAEGAPGEDLRRHRVAGRRAHHGDVALELELALCRRLVLGSPLSVPGVDVHGAHRVARAQRCAYEMLRGVRDEKPVRLVVFDVSNSTRECKKCPRITPTSLVEARFARTVALPRDARRTHARRHLEGRSRARSSRRRSYPSRAAFAGTASSPSATACARCHRRRLSRRGRSGKVRRARAASPARAARRAGDRVQFYSRRPSLGAPSCGPGGRRGGGGRRQSQRTRAGAPRSPACGRAF